MRSPHAKHGRRVATWVEQDLQEPSMAGWQAKLTDHADLPPELPLRPFRQPAGQGGSPQTWGAGAAA